MGGLQNDYKFSKAEPMQALGLANLGTYISFLRPMLYDGSVCIGYNRPDKSTLMTLLLLIVGIIFSSN